MDSGSDANRRNFIIFFSNFNKYNKELGNSVHNEISEIIFFITEHENEAIIRNSSLDEILQPKWTHRYDYSIRVLH